MADFNIRSESVDVEQIMKQIRGRIKEKRGVDYTEEQVRELVQDLNTRILDARRRGIDGPKIVIGEVDVERVVREWRERRAAS